jgi:hypothetical protein
MGIEFESMSKRSRDEFKELVLELERLGHAEGDDGAITTHSFSNPNHGSDAAELPGLGFEGQRLNASALSRAQRSSYWPWARSNNLTVPEPPGLWVSL